MNFFKKYSKVHKKYKLKEYRIEQEKLRKHLQKINRNYLFQVYTVILIMIKRMIILLT